MTENGKEAKQKIAYELFVESERTGAPITVEQIVESTSWARKTVTTYITKKWEPFLFRCKEGFKVDGISEYSESAFIRLMSQKDSLSNDPHRPQLRQEVEGLVAKAREAAVLALDIYNRPSTLFKTEGFSVLMIIAWRSLFHAIFEKNNTDYYHYSEDGSIILIDGDPKSWELSLCVAEFFKDVNNPIRANLEFMIQLRNKIEHRYIPSIDPHVAGECQALLLNFDDYITQHFGSYYAIKETLSVPLQTANVRTEQQIEVMKKFQGSQYDKIREFLEEYRGKLPADIYSDPKFSFRVFLIPKLGNHENSSDLAFEFVRQDPNAPESIKELNQKIALIRDKHVPVANQGLYRPSKVSWLVQEAIGQKFSPSFHHAQAWKKYEVRAKGNDPKLCKNKYCQFDTVHEDYIYTNEWVQFLIDKLSDPVEYQSLIDYKEK